MHLDMSNAEMKKGNMAVSGASAPSSVTLVRNVAAKPLWIAFKECSIKETA